MKWCFSSSAPTPAADGFLRFVAAGKEVLASDPSGLYNHELCGRLVDWDAAGATARVMMGDHQDAIAQIVGLLDLHPVVRIEPAKASRQAS